jgi:hypothetical protein
VNKQFPAHTDNQSVGQETQCRDSGLRPGRTDLQRVPFPADELAADQRVVSQEGVGRPESSGREERGICGRVGSESAGNAEVEYL